MVVKKPTETLYGSKGHTEHPPIKQTSTSSIWLIPFTKVCGGHLVVTVTVRVGGTTQIISSKNEDKSKDQEWLVVGTKLTPGAIRTFVNKIAATSDEANRRAFRKLIKRESSLQQFRELNYFWPKYSSDGQGGVGLCQLTKPEPTLEQTWNWKENVRGGWALYQEKQRIARSYPRRVRTGDTFRNLVAAWNTTRAAQGLPTLPVTLPDYTPEQLARDTLRAYNGYANGLHEYRLPRLADDTLNVTVNDNGTHGTVEWEQVPASERGNQGDANYVDRVLAETDF